MIYFLEFKKSVPIKQGLLGIFDNNYITKLLLVFLDVIKVYQSVSRAVLPPKAPGDNSFLISSHFWWPWMFLDMWHAAPLSASEITWAPPLLCVFLKKVFRCT